MPRGRIRRVVAWRLGTREQLLPLTRSVREHAAALCSAIAHDDSITADVDAAESLGATRAAAWLAYAASVISRKQGQEAWLHAEAMILSGWPATRTLKVPWQGWPWGGGDTRKRL